MRNLKRALSLTLASVMLLGMMVVGSSAAGYPDVSDEDNVEAIEVLQKVAVMEGDNNGNFNPDDYVTREQMAVIMSKLLNLDYNYYQGTNPFSDVPAWAAPYVAACAANGITSGIGGGMYGAGQNVNAVQAALMMLKALGYFQYQADFGQDYVLATVSRATQVGLFDRIDSKADQALTRNEVAQMALNALQSEMVTFTGDPGVEYTGSNGESWIGGYKPEYTARTSTQSKYQAIERRTSDVAGGNNLNRGQYYVQLGEELYNGDLRLSDSALDDFGRPSRTWSYKGEEIGTYAKKELLVKSYNLAVKGSEIYNQLSQATIRDYDINAYVDGAWNVGSAAGQIDKNDLVRSNNSDLADTGRGVLTELYRDDDNEQFYIVSINTWLAQATVDYNESSETITLVVYDGKDGSNITKRVDVEEAPYVAGMKKDDWCLVQWADETDPHAAKTVVDAFATEIMEDKAVTGFNRGKSESADTTTGPIDRVTKITTDGTDYSNNENAWYKNDTLNDFDANQLVNKTYTLFMDQFGNFIGVELYSGDNQYVFITGYDRSTSHISVNTAKASAIFTDGTMSAIDVNIKDTDKNIADWNAAHTDALEIGYASWRTSGIGDGETLENMWYKYTLNNGVYTLAPVDGYTRDINVSGTERTVNCSNIYLTHNGDLGTPVANGDYGTGRSYGEDASVYITVDYDAMDIGSGIAEVTGLYTGVQDVNLVLAQNQWIHAVYEDNYIVAAIVYGDAEGIVDNYAYIRSGVNREWKEVDSNGNTIHYWEFDAVMNGEKVTKTIKSRFANTTRELIPGTIQELVIDADGYVTKIKNLKNVADTEPGTRHSDNEVYDNTDFNSTLITSLKGYSIYHVTTVLPGNATYLYGNINGSYYGRPEAGVGATTIIKNTDTLSGLRIDNSIDLAFQGNTLRYTTSNNDIGLPVTKTAKAVVRQVINGSTTWENYDTVAAAYAMLNDADGDSSNNIDGVKQFNGEVAAVLNNNGVAEWVVFFDRTPTQGKPGNYPTNPTNRTYVTSIGLNGQFLDITRTDVVSGQPSMTYAVSEIVNWLANNGYTVLNMTSLNADVPTAGTPYHVGGTLNVLKADGTFGVLIPRYVDKYNIRVNNNVVDTVVYGADSTKVTDTYVENLGNNVGTGYVVGASHTTYSHAGTVISAATNVTGPVSITTGYVTVADNVVNTTPTANTSGATVTISAADWDNSNAKAGSEQTIELNFNQNLGQAKPVVITVTGGAETVTKTVPASAIQSANAADRKVTMTIKLGNGNLAASAISVSLAAGTAEAIVPQELKTVSSATLTSGVAMDYSTAKAAGGTDLQNWCTSIMRNMVKQDSGLYKMPAELRLAMNDTTTPGMGGACDDCLVFVYQIPANTSGKYYHYVIWDNTGAIVAAESTASMSAGATGAGGIMYIHPNPISNALTGSSSLTSGANYRWAIYEAGTAASGNLSDYSIPAGSRLVNEGTFTAK